MKGKVEILVDDEDPSNPEMAIVASGASGIAALVSIFTAASLAFIGRGDEAAAGCPPQFITETEGLSTMVQKTGLELLDAMDAKLDNVTIIDEKPVA